MMLKGCLPFVFSEVRTSSLPRWPLLLNGCHTRLDYYRNVSSSPYIEKPLGLKVPSIFKSMKSEENPITAEILFNSTFVFSWRLFSVACQFFLLSCLTLSYEITKHNQLEG